jgi:hypothetical protein
LKYRGKGTNASVARRCRYNAMDSFPEFLADRDTNVVDAYWFGNDQALPRLQLISEI